MKIEEPNTPEIIEYLQSVLDRQEGGNHYKELAIQPIEIAHKNKLCFRIFSALKYMMRHDKKGGEQELDIRKAIHYLQILLEQEYNIKSSVHYEKKNPT